MDTKDIEKEEKSEKEKVNELMRHVYEEQKRLHPEMYEKPKE